MTMSGHLSWVNSSAGRGRRQVIAHELQRDLSSDMSIDALLTRILDKVSEFLVFNNGVVLLDDGNGSLVPRAVKTDRPQSRLGISSTLVDLVKKERTGLLSVDALNDERLKDADSLILEGVRSTLAVPIVSQGELLGVMILDSTSRSNAFGAKDLQLISGVAAHMAQSVRNSLLNEELRLLFDSSISALAATVDARHPLTAGHSQRVATYSVMIAQELGLEDAVIGPLLYAALLHDIGKIGIPDAVLLKDGPFTPQERETMNGHPQKTRVILEKFRFPARLRDVPRIAGCHHEKINGQGYPAGLTGMDIPLEARVIAVADVFDALTSARDYPKYDRDHDGTTRIMSTQQARTIIERDAGTHFDPAVVQAFVSCLPRIEMHARQTIQLPSV